MVSAENNCIYNNINYLFFYQCSELFSYEADVIQHQNFFLGYSKFWLNLFSVYTHTCISFAQTLTREG